MPSITLDFSAFGSEELAPSPRGGPGAGEHRAAKEEQAATRCSQPKPLCPGNDNVQRLFLDRMSQRARMYGVVQNISAECGPSISRAFSDSLKSEKALYVFALSRFRTGKQSPVKNAVSGGLKLHRAVRSGREPAPDQDIKTRQPP